MHIRNRGTYMPLLKKTIMWGFFLAAMYFGGLMTQSGSNLLQGMGFMSILAALICLYLVMKLIWGPLSHYMKLALCAGVVWYCAYSIGLFDGNTLQSFLSGATPVITKPQKSVSDDEIVALNELEDAMFTDKKPEDTVAGITPVQPAPAKVNNGGLIQRIKVFLFGDNTPENTAPRRPFNPFEYPEIKGYPEVVTGSILYLEGIKVKLLGIDAPNLNQICVNHMGSDYNCGEKSVEWLQDWLNGKEVSCHILSRVERGQATGSCFTDDKSYDVAAVIVNAGWAVAYTRTTDIYVPYEQQAAEAHRGLWGGTFYRPEDWRRLQNRKVQIKVKRSAPKFNFGGWF